ncbi:MAG: redox-sensitive transcriptional activator SoxR [Phycisphaerae bacterium]|nr:redox-sensitive transcriptional activator SoxR [Gemmatimonadaceae bacterium]
MVPPPRAYQPLFTIGELARRTGVAASALRFYESLGLIGSVRTSAGHRRYPRPSTRRVAFILFAQKLGLTLDEVRAELATLPAGRAPDLEEWQQLSTRWEARVTERIAQLELLRSGLVDCIGCGCLSLERCHMLNPGDRAAALGPGPRWWMGDKPSQQTEKGADALSDVNSDRYTDT